MNQHRRMRRSHGHVYSDRKSGHMTVTWASIRRKIHRRRRIVRLTNQNRRHRWNRRGRPPIRRRVSIVASEAEVNRIDESATLKAEALTRCARKTWMIRFWYRISLPKTTRRVRAAIDECRRWLGRFRRPAIRALGSSLLQTSHDESRRFALDGLLSASMRSLSHGQLPRVVSPSFDVVVIGKLR